MLFRFNSAHLILGWLLTLVGLIAMVAGGRGYLTDAAVRLGMFFAGLVAVVAGSALVRWARRAPPE